MKKTVAQEIIAGMTELTDALEARRAPHLLAMEDLPIPYRLAASPPTKRQAEVLQFVTTYWRDYQRGPSLRDIAEATGIVSMEGVMCHIRALSKKGLIEAASDAKARGIWPAGLRACIKAAVMEFMTKQGG